MGEPATRKKKIDDRRPYTQTFILRLYNIFYIVSCVYNFVRVFSCYVPYLPTYNMYIILIKCT